MVGEGAGVFSKKAGRKKRKEGAFRKKVHKFLFVLSPFSKIKTFFSQNLRSFKTKSLLLRLIKHNFPFIPPHCGVHIAQSRGTVPDHPAQTLFDLLNRRDFALSRPIGTSLKDAVPQHGVAFARQRRYPFGLCRKKVGQGTGFCSIRKGAFAFLQQRIFASPIRFLSYHPCSESSCVWSVFCAVFRNYRRESASFVERPNTKLPTSLRKTRFVGSCIIS